MRIENYGYRFRKAQEGEYNDGEKLKSHGGTFRRDAQRTGSTRTTLGTLLLECIRTTSLGFTMDNTHFRPKCRMGSDLDVKVGDTNSVGDNTNAELNAAHDTALHEHTVLREGIKDIALHEGAAVHGDTHVCLKQPSCTTASSSNTRS